MKKIYSGFLLLLTLVPVSCHTSSGKCGPCPLAAIDMRMKVKIVGKTTGADLFLSPNSPYKASDLKVSNSLNDTNFRFNADTSDTNNRFVRLYDGQAVTYTLKLGNLTADQIKIVTAINDRKCCATTYVKSITLNDSLICSTYCNPQLELVIKK